MLAKTPNPPYYAVIFSSVRTEKEKGYSDMAAHMIELASNEKGFLGIESARSEIGITVSYWESLEAIKTWKENSEHRLAQKLGKTDWYKLFKIRICKVERQYEWCK